MHFLVYVKLFFYFHLAKSGSVVEDVTSALLPDSGNEIVAAFGDFDADKLTDIFIICNHGMLLSPIFSPQGPATVYSSSKIHHRGPDSLLLSPPYFSSQGPATV